MKKKIFTIKNICTTAVMSTISIILYLFGKIKLIGIFPEFLEFQFSELPCIIVGYMFGPLLGIISVIIRFIGKIIFMGSESGLVGEFGDLLIGIVLVITSSLIYRKNKTLKRAIHSFGVATIFSTITACIINAFVLIPWYIHVMSIPMEVLIEMCKTVKFITIDNFMSVYIFLIILPFNILRYVLVGFLTFLLYKRIHKIVEKIK